MNNFENHTFAICAYKESNYLEECIKSVLNQTLKSNILIATSTPNEHIVGLGEKYDIPVYIRDGKPDIQDDWNFAYSNANTEYVTIAHQDDIYDKDYSNFIKKSIKQGKKQVIFFTNYLEIKNEEVIPLTENLKIKKIMLYPLRLNILRGSKLVRRIILSLGSPICCPSVTINKKLNGENIFRSDMKCNLDWDTWFELSKKSGQFVYINKDLMFHRIHEESETSNSIENNVRQSEDYRMFRKFWPKPIAKLIAKAYAKSINTNKI